MPEASCPQTPPMSLQHCFSAAVSCASGMAHAMIGHPNRRTTSSSRTLIISLIGDKRLQLTDRPTQCRQISDTVRLTKLSEKNGLVKKNLVQIQIRVKNVSRIFHHFPITRPRSVGKCRQFSVIGFARGSLVSSRSAIELRPLDRSDRISVIGRLYRG